MHIGMENDVEPSFVEMVELKRHGVIECGHYFFTLKPIASRIVCNDDLQLLVPVAAVFWFLLRS